MRDLSSDLYDDAFRCGRFGALRVGAERAAVLKWLDVEVGPAWAKRVEGHQFLNYHLQVWFQRSVVVSFGLYFRYERTPTVRIPGLTLSATTPREAVVEWLDANDIEHEQGYFPHLLELPHAQVAFDENNTLDSLQISKTRAPSL